MLTSQIFLINVKNKNLELKLNRKSNTHKFYMKKTIQILVLTSLPMLGFAQKTKVQNAWRALNDYESTLMESTRDLCPREKSFARFLGRLLGVLTRAGAG